MSQDYGVQGTCFSPAWKNILLHLWVTSLAKVFALSQRHVLTCTLDAIKLGLAIVWENVDLYPVLDFGAFAMVASVGIILFLDCQMMGIALTEHVKNSSLEFLVLVHIRTSKRWKISILTNNSVKQGIF